MLALTGVRVNFMTLSVHRDSVTIGSKTWVGSEAFTNMTGGDLPHRPLLMMKQYWYCNLSLPDHIFIRWYYCPSQNDCVHYVKCKINVVSETRCEGCIQQETGVGGPSLLYSLMQLINVIYMMERCRVQNDNQVKANRRTILFESRAKRGFTTLISHIFQGLRSIGYVVLFRWVLRLYWTC